MDITVFGINNIIMFVAIIFINVVIPEFNERKNSIRTLGGASKKTRIKNKKVVDNFLRGAYFFLGMATPAVCQWRNLRGTNNKTRASSSWLLQPAAVRECTRTRNWIMVDSFSMQYVGAVLLISFCRTMIFLLVSFSLLVVLLWICKWLPVWRNW